MKIDEFSFSPKFCCQIAGYQAWNVRELLPGLKASAQVVFLSADEEAVAVAGEEILEGGVYLAVEGDLPDGSGDFFSCRLLIPKDIHKRRWCKDIVEIKIEEGDG